MRLREARELVRTTQLGASVVMKGVVTESFWIDLAETTGEEGN